MGSQGQVGAQWLAPVRTGQTQVVWLPVLSSGTQPQGPSSWSALQLCPCLTPMSLPSGTGLAGFPSCHPRRNGPELMGLRSMDQARLRPWPVPEPLPWVSVLGRTRASVTMGPGRSASLCDVGFQLLPSGTLTARRTGGQHLDSPGPRASAQAWRGAGTSMDMLAALPIEGQGLGLGHL